MWTYKKKNKGICLVPILKIGFRGSKEFIFPSIDFFKLYYVVELGPADRLVGIFIQRRIAALAEK